MTTTLAILSDTHMDAPDRRLAYVYDHYLAAADIVVHCGDHVGASVHHFLARHPHLVAVRGNCDWDDGLAALPQFAEFHVGGQLVGACHGWGPRSGVPRRVAEHFGPGYSLVCFGHTHARHFAAVDGVLLLNPGSLAQGSMAIAALADDRWDCRFIDL